MGTHNVTLGGAGLGSLEKRKISYLFRDSKLGPLSPLTSRYADWSNPAPTVGALSQGIKRLRREADH